jgi:hypothetical protein
MLDAENNGDPAFGGVAFLLGGLGDFGQPKS